MPDLEKAISDWRREMSAGGFTDPESLEELESHLRDELEHQIGLGIQADIAFQNTIKTLGSPAALDREFQKISGPLERIVMKATQTSGIMPPFYPIETPWKTYAKTAAWLLPCLSFWMISSLFLIPKLQVVLQDWGLKLPSTDQGIVALSQFASSNGLAIVLIVLATLALLEWRIAAWSKFRKATLMTIAFVLNAAILYAITSMVLILLKMAPSLAAK